MNRQNVLGGVAAVVLLALVASPALGQFFGTGSSPSSTSGALTPSSVVTPFVDAGVVWGLDVHATTLEVDGTSHIGPMTVAGGGNVSIASNTGLIMGANGFIQLGAGDSIYTGTAYLLSMSAPTVTGFCTSPSVAWNAGSSTFEVNVGTSCTGISTGTITFFANANGWSCACDNKTAPTTRTIGTTTWANNSITVTNFSRTAGTAADFADGALVRCGCHGG
jgi:hypothetical protein